MIKIRQANERGVANFDWLHSKHSFSFGDYYDADQMGFGPLRVINEDVVQPSGGFDTHGHKDMEIVSYVLNGALEHKDSIGNGSAIRPGDVQRMSAGTGIRHSEFNSSTEEPVHFLQIWILPEQAGLAPSYEQKTFPLEADTGQLRLIGSRDGRANSVVIHQDVDLYNARLNQGQSVTYEPKLDRKLWLQVASGSLDLNGNELQAGDGAAIENEQHFAIKALSNDVEFLLFDMVSL